MEHITKWESEKEGRRKGCRNKRDRGSRRGKGASEKKEGEERGRRKSKLPTPVPYVNTYLAMFLDVLVCAG